MAVDLLALLIGLGLGGCISRLMTGIGISGADGTGVGGSWFWRHFFQIRVLTRKIANSFRIMTAGEVKVQGASVSFIWDNWLNSSLVSKVPLNFVLSPWII